MCLRQTAAASDKSLGLPGSKKVITVPILRTDRSGAEVHLTKHVTALWCTELCAGGGFLWGSQFPCTLMEACISGRRRPPCSCQPLQQMEVFVGVDFSSCSTPLSIPFSYILRSLLFHRVFTKILACCLLVTVIFCGFSIQRNFSHLITSSVCVTLLQHY